jgi:hypothetical protein
MTRVAARARTKPRLKGKAREARRLLLVGLCSLVPPVLYLGFLLAGRRLGLQGALDVVQGWDDSLAGSALLALVGMGCPVVTMSCGLGLVSHRGRLRLAITLMVVGAVLLAAALIVRPS